MTNTDWPNKDERENYEINEFVLQYARLPRNRELEVVEKREKPDYVARDKHTKKKYGIELTSVYLSDTSVPNEHIPTLKMRIGNGIDLDRSEIEDYKERVTEAVKCKIEKAKNGYDQSHPLILSVYINEYRAIFMDRKDCEEMVHKNQELFNAMSPFIEVVFWGLASNDVFLITPDNENSKV